MIEWILEDQRLLKGNTVGSRLRIAKVDLAYIAGFLDGDGSLMLQIKKRKDSSIGVRFMVTICFYQDTRHEGPLYWIRNTLGIGYVSRRNDGMSELRINGFERVGKIIDQLMPFIRFKEKQAAVLQSACELLSRKSFEKLSQHEKKQLMELMLTMQIENYQSRGKKSKAEIKKILNLTP